MTERSHPSMAPWSTPEARRWARLLLDSHRRFVGESLLNEGGDHAAALWHSDIVVLSHRISDDPILVYGNRAALDLWSMTWDAFTAMASRLTAEPDLRAERAGALAEARATGCTRNYGGVRITADGRRFRIEQATLWNVVDEEGEVVGQAAAFAPTVTWLSAVLPRGEPPGHRGR